ncbi:hypothetical protein ACI3EY_13090 [Ornithinimicrobium sp. LYQ92]|uniref:hypothetical protein n=1 Tax=Serinicoccus sp. LYQ92 TaxID=3378798 RepID=UPI0038551212
MSPTRTTVVGVVLAVLVAPALAGAGLAEEPQLSTTAEGVFHPDSPFYRPLPEETPVADNSQELVASLYRQGEENFGSPGSPNITINTDNYTAPLIVATASDPEYDIGLWNCQDKDPGWDVELREALRGTHLPEDLEPDASSDGNVSIYNRDTGRLVELWQTRQTVDGGWEACWGGVIEDASMSEGSFPVPYGAAAGGLAMWGYTIRQQELLDGRIDHVIGVGIPRVKQGVISWPAVRSDGRNEGDELAMGQRLRLPADLDLDEFNLSPTARTVAQAAQEYGFIVTDTSGAIALAGEHVLGLEEDRYEEIFRGRYSSQEMAGDPARGEDPFPLELLVALPVDYGQHAEPLAPEEAGPETATATEEPETAEADEAVPTEAAGSDAPVQASESEGPAVGRVVAAGAVAVATAALLTIVVLRRRT